MLVSRDATRAGRVGKMLGVPTIIPDVVTGESKTGVNSSLGLVTKSVRSAKKKRQDFTHKRLVMRM